MGREVRDSHWGIAEDILVADVVVVVVVRVDAVEASLFSGGVVVNVFVKDYLLLPSFPALTQDPAIDQSVGFPTDD